MTIREFMQVTKINQANDDELFPIEDIDIDVYQNNTFIMTWDLEQYLDNQIKRLEIMCGRGYGGERPAPTISIYI